jgi:hypothetical protein
MIHLQAVWLWTAQLQTNAFAHAVGVDPELGADGASRYQPSLTSP